MAEVMAAVAYLAAHPELPRATIRSASRPTRRSARARSCSTSTAFGAACAYTFDGSEAGEFTDETFTAASADLTIHGVDVHPGHRDRQARQRRAAGRPRARRAAAGPPDAGVDLRPRGLHPRPRGRRRRPGAATIRTIVRDFDDDAARRARRAAAPDGRGGRGDRAARAAGVRGRAPVPEHAHATSTRTRRCPRRREEAIRREGFEPRRVPVRGGTDGSILSARGLPTPNIFTGGHEYHSVREWASVQDMASAAAVAVRLAGVWAERRPGAGRRLS